MIKKVALLLLAAMGTYCMSFAQKTCGNTTVYEKMKREHPEIARYEEEFEQALKQELSHRNLAKTTNVNDTTYYDIPVVIHIIHDYGQENLSDNAIIDAFNYWASIYVGQNYDDTAYVIQPFKQYIGNPRIRLHLATKDPDGNPTKGIVRHQSYLTTNAGDEAKLDQWPPSSYLNIWFINTFSGEYTGAAAYAYLPMYAQYLPYYDGVIGLYSYLNYDKAIPHEIGHELNLLHTWGNTNQPDVACGDDDVDDTPPTMGHNPVGCVTSALYDVTCAQGYTKTYQNVLGLDSIVDYPDTVNSQNIMDYTYCQLMFTKGQAERMRISLTSNIANRNNLYSAQNLATTGALDPMPDLAPVADFSVEKGYGPSGYTAERAFFLCANNPTKFYFRNRSWNDTISSLQWTLSNGASTATSTANVAISNFSQPGWATVTLTATSNAGSGTFSRQVYVADTVAIQPASYIEDFSGADTAKWPMFNYYNNTFKWSLCNKAGYDDQYSVVYNSFDDRPSPENKTGTPNGDYDDIFTPGFDLTGATATGNAYLNFYTAGAKANSAATDSLDIYVTTNCGTAWTKIATLTGNTLTNDGTHSGSAYVPALQSEWMAHSIAIPSTYRADKTFFRFRYRPSEGGNNFYIDKFAISGYTSVAMEIMNNANVFKLYPNPASNGCNIAFAAGQDGKISYTIKDITGKLLYQKNGLYPAHTPEEEYIPKSVFPAAGMYFITLTSEGKSATQKLVVY